MDKKLKDEYRDRILNQVNYVSDLMESFNSDYYPEELFFKTEEKLTRIIDKIKEVHTGLEQMREDLINQKPDESPKGDFRNP